jgi:pimeloyl-ACP methyl ester carboxylesterase
MHHIRRGTGSPLLLIHGLGSNWRTWLSIMDALAAEREVIAVDLPGFGESPPLTQEPSIPALADAVTDFMVTQGLTGADLVGSSMGARLVLELARRGATGTTIALDPGGFWNSWQLRYFEVTLKLSIRLVRILQPVMPALTKHAMGRTLLLSQLSARPWSLSRPLVLGEMRSYAASPSFDAALNQLIYGPVQQGADVTLGRVVIGWGRKDRLCVPSQAIRALQLFPRAQLHWFEDCGHFPHWDVPEAATGLILSGTTRATPLKESAPAKRPVHDQSSTSETRHRYPRENKEQWQ